SDPSFLRFAGGCLPEFNTLFLVRVMPTPSRDRSAIGREHRVHNIIRRNPFGTFPSACQVPKSNRAVLTQSHKRSIRCERKNAVFSFLPAEDSTLPRHHIPNPHDVVLVLCRNQVFAVRAEDGLIRPPF